MENLRADVAVLWRRYYPGYSPEAFSERVQNLVQPADAVLEIGAGSGSGQQVSFPLKGRCARYVGIDLDSRVVENPYVDEGLVADATKLPFPNQSFNLVFHRMVAEHLENPLAALLEANRVLKPGGILLFETPNKYYYPMLLARMTPTSFHKFAVRKFGSGRTEAEVFPTFYRLNSRRAIQKLCKDACFESKVELISTPPGYLRSSTLLFRMGVLYERTFERAFKGLRGRLVVQAAKISA